MEHYFVYLFQYIKDEDRLNRIYAHTDMLLDDRDSLINKIQSFVKNKNSTITEIANTIEEEILKKQKFIRLKGIKTILPSYIHKIKID